MTKADAAYFRSFHETVSERLAERRAQEDTLEAELDEVRQEIVRLEQILSATEPFTYDMKARITSAPVVNGISELPLADAIRKILEHRPQARTPRGIRDALAINGYDLLQHNNALASIHGVLKRMADSGEIERIEVDNKTRYRGKATASSRPPMAEQQTAKPSIPPPQRRIVTEKKD